MSTHITSPATDLATVEIRHDEPGTRFEAIVNGMRCVADYRMRGDVMVMTHTGVPTALEGRGIASKLVRAAFDHARANGLRIDPQCSYVAAWARRHPEVASLLV